MRSYLGTSNINNIAPWVHGAHTHFHEVWIAEKAGKYFGDRDALALEFVENLALPAPQ